MNETCPECGSPEVSVIYHDEKLGESGPITLVCEAEAHEFYVPAEATARSRIGALRAIVREHQAARIDGYIVDAFTASILVTIYDALSPENREKFGKPNLARLVDFGWQSVSR